MSVTVKYKASFVKGTKCRTRRTSTSGSRKEPSRAARMLALAHHVDRLVEDGEIADYAEAARILGVTRARMTQIVNLLNLAPGVQEGLLLGTVNVSERRLRRVDAVLSWAKNDSGRREVSVTTD